ncbi:hypothetical protein RHODO2019_10895 [Rhodococcus antarcticus]|uniref:Major tail protein n=1 Tax=Rhodococcus antarcticus TaxID=2987751 RepID=A0ABY6NWE3_9NOCA|nr:hypothetical protein [Rhodococcus antarcticus]UZJ23714.1 hypothetical protein RHODO2019_10895 [Rhodococcus antarcticus]
MLNDNAVLAIDTGTYLTAPTGTALPTNLLAPATPWDQVGHTSLDNVFSLSSEGGEATILGTLQNKSLRTRYSARSETMGFTLQQFDKEGLKLFYGSNAPELADGTLGVPTDPKPTIAAFLVVFVDGEHQFAFYAPKAEIYRGDDMSLSDTESLAGLPLAVKPMALGTNKWTYAVTPLASVASGIKALSATAGAPGTYQPSNADAPANLTALQTDVTASPTTAWTTGQFVNLADASFAYWTGTAWTSGKKA